MYGMRARKEINMVIPKYERRLFYRTFVNVNEMVDVMNHDRITKRDIIGIFSKGDYTVVIYEKVVEVNDDRRI